MCVYLCVCVCYCFILPSLPWSRHTLQYGWPVAHGSAPLSFGTFVYVTHITVKDGPELPESPFLATPE